MFIDLSPGNLIDVLTGRNCPTQRIYVEVSARAASLQQEGLQHGDRVFVFYGNTIEFFLDLLAVWQIGACLIPIDNRLTAFEITNLCQAVRPRIALGDGTQAADVLGAINAAGVKLLDCQLVGEASARGRVARPLACRAALDDEALILFTSGSTGTPKGVVHTHRSLRARWLSLRQALGIRAYERTLCLLPTHFGHGLICNCLYPWLSGQDLFIAPPFSMESLMQLSRLIDEHDITFLSSVPSMWSLTLKAS